MRPGINRASAVRDASQATLRSRQIGGAGSRGGSTGFPATLFAHLLVMMYDRRFVSGLAESVAEAGFGALFDVSFHLAPITAVVAHLFALGANRQEAVERFDLGQCALELIDQFFAFHFHLMPIDGHFNGHFELPLVERSQE